MRPNLNIFGCVLTVEKLGKAVNSAPNVVPPDPKDLKDGFAAAETAAEENSVPSVELQNLTMSARDAAGNPLTA